MKKILLLLAILAAAQPALAADKSISLDELVVTATRTEESVENVAQDVTIISKDDIAAGAYTSIADTLMNVVGVTVRENGNRASLASVALRGSNAQQVLVLLDGKRLNKAGDGMADLNSIPVLLESIERIEVLRGASSALYGAEAMGGVINIITKGTGDPFTKVSLSYGSSDTWNGIVATSRKIKDFGYFFSADREQSSGFRINSDYGIWGVNSKFTYDFSKDFHADLNADFNSKDTGAPGLGAFPTPKARQKDENEMFGLTFRFKDSIAKLYSHSSKIHFTDPAHFTDTTNRSNVLGADIQSSMLIGTSHLVTGGSELLDESIDTTDIGSKHRTRKGIFIQDEISISDPLTLTLGARYDDFGGGSQLSPKGSVICKATQATTFRLAAGQGYRIPTLNDLYWPHNLYDYSGYIYEESGNPDLKPEKSTEFEASVEQKIGGNVTLKALGFYKKVKNLIKWADLFPADFTHDYYTPQNITKATIKGTELTATARFTLVDLEMSYYYEEPKDSDTGEMIADLPRQELAGSVTAHPVKGLNWTAEGRYVSNYTLPGSPKWCYFVLNSKLSKKIALPAGEGEIFITGKNLLDRSYETSRGYPMPPVELFVGISIRF